MSRVSRQNLLRLVCAAALFFSGWLIISGLNRSSQRSTDAVPAGRSMAAGRRYATQPIEQIQVGDRVHARNPQVEQHERASWSDPNWQQWVHLSLTMPLDDGGELKVELLRPESWLLEHFNLLVEEPPAAQPVKFAETALASDGDSLERELAVDADFPFVDVQPSTDRVLLAPVRPIYRELAIAVATAEHLSGAEVLGITVDLDLPEMGASGVAVLDEIAPCPPILAGEGQPVTATFAHPPSRQVLDVHFEGESEPIGVTDNHLFWSVTRQQFLPIGKMQIGEQVQTFFGETKRLEQRLPRPGPSVVYNLEVFGEHVYFVGQQGLLAHNQYEQKRLFTPTKHGFRRWDGRFIGNAKSPGAAQAAKSRTPGLGDMGEKGAKGWLRRHGYTDVHSIQNPSGHGIDIVARHRDGTLTVFEVKTSAGSIAPALSKAQRNVMRFIRTRIQRAIQALKHWTTTPKAVRDLAREAQEEIAEGKIRRYVIEITNATNPNAPTKLKIRKWQN